MLQLHVVGMNPASDILKKKTFFTVHGQVYRMVGNFGAIKVWRIWQMTEFANFSPSKYFAGEENSKPSLELINFLATGPDIRLEPSLP